MQKKRPIFENIFIYLLIIFLIISQSILFRWEIFEIFDQTTKLKLNRLNYISNVVINDIFFALIAALFLSLFGRIRFLLVQFVFIGVFLQLLVIFFVLCLTFSNLYELPFTYNVTGELSSTWREFVHSGFAEITLRRVIVTAAASLFNWTVLAYIYTRINLIQQKKDAEIFRRFYERGTVLLILIFFAIIIGFIYYLKPSPDVTEQNTFLQNPVIQNVLLALRPEDAGNFEDIDFKSFRFGLNTNSLVSDKLYPRLNLIPRGKKYNIIVYLFESTCKRYLGLKHEGVQLTPNWLRMERHAFVAERHYVNFPLSINSLFSVLSSSYSLPSNCWVPNKFPRIKIKSLPEILSEVGYKTALFHSSYLSYAGQNKYLSHRKFDRLWDFNDLRRHRGKYKQVVNFGVDDRVLVEQAVDYAKSVAPKPFFVTIMPCAPHHPYSTPEQKFDVVGYISKRTPRKKKRWLKYLSALYYADATLGLLVEKLEKAKLADNTLIFVMADHGQGFYQHKGNYSHPLYIYEENVYVPFLIYNKKIFRKKYSYKGVSRHIDVLPTILDILNLPRLKYQEGYSLLSGHVEQLADLHTHWRVDFTGIRDGKWKYIREMKSKKELLFDLEIDPDETNNLVETNLDLSERFRKFVINSRKYKIMYFNKILGHYRPGKRKFKKKKKKDNDHENEGEGEGEDDRE